MVLLILTIQLRKVTKLRYREVAAHFPLRFIHRVDNRLLLLLLGAREHVVQVV